MAIGRVVIFVGILTALIAAFSLYVGWRLIPSSWSPPARTAAWIGVGVVVLLQPTSFLMRFTHRPLPFADAVSWAGYIAMGLFALLLTFTLARDLGWLGVRIVGALPQDPARRAALFDMTSAAVAAASGGAFLVGLARAVEKPNLVEVSVPIANLPARLEGFTIAQVSDIHIGPTIKRGFLEEVVAMVNGLGADLVAVTGDLVDGSVDELREQTAPLGRLQARHGAWFITGNHEYYSGAEEWLAEVRRLGLKTLVNEHTVLEHEGERVVVAGVTDYSAGGVMPAHATDPVKAAAGAPDDAGLRVMLAHQPRSAFEVAKLGFHLQLSGHTHGGQFFPGTLIIRLVQPFVDGLHRLGDLWVYTNSGTGYWGPPVRHTSVTSEVTRLTLVRARDANTAA